MATARKYQTKKQDGGDRRQKLMELLPILILMAITVALGWILVSSFGE